MSGVLPGFSDHAIEIDGQAIAYSSGGSGPPVLMLHGYPQTRAMWRGVAPVLARHFTVVAADLRGYGDSDKPRQMEAMSFRPMADDQRALMSALGHPRFHLVGHDRGARTAHRLALDTPEAVLSLTLMDIVPTHLLLDDLSKEVARGYYHWFFLAQPNPFPERMIGHDPDAYFENCLTAWGGASIDDYDAAALAAYRTAWRDPAMIRASCDDYRAAIDVDFQLDAADLGRRLDMPALIVYGADGAMARAYDVPGTWSDRLSCVESSALPGGHFFPDLEPEKTAATLLDFLQRAAA